MSQNHKPLSWVAMGPDLIQCLKSGGNHRLSRFDAFVWLIEHIGQGTTKHDNEGNIIGSSPFTSSYKRLAEEWRWERHTVQSFIEELVATGAISTIRDGNLLVFSLGKDSVSNLLQ